MQIAGITLRRAVRCGFAATLSLSAASASAQTPATPAPSASRSAAAPMTLQQAVSLAQEHGQSARAALATLEANRWRDRAFGASLMPQLSLAGQVPNLNRAIIPVIQPDGTTQFVPQSQMQSSFSLRMSQQVPWSGSQLFLESGLSRLDLIGNNQSSRVWQSSPVVVGIRQDLFRPNSLKWDAREQNIRAGIAERQYVEAKEEIALNTANAFFDLYNAQTQLENAQLNAGVNDTLFQLSKGRFEVGKIGENDLLQNELALLRSRASVDAAKLDYDRALSSLRLLIGAPADMELSITPPPILPPLAIDPDVAVAHAMRNRSDLETQDLQRMQANRRVREAKLNNGFGATVTARAGLNQTAPTASRAYASLLDQQQLGVSVEMPFFQWGGGRAQVEAARADQERVASVTKMSRDAMEQDVHFAALQFTQAERQIALAAKADTVGQKRYEVARNRYLIGKIGIGELFIAQSEKDAARQAYVQALRGYWVAFHRVRRATLFDFALGREIRAK